MERHDSTMRAARYLLGAGTFAVAMLAMSAGSASAQTNSCISSEGGEGDPTVCGHVFTDGNSDSNYTPGEGSPGSGVVLKDGPGADANVVSNPTESSACNAPDCGYFAFIQNEPGTYWVCLADLTDPNLACVNTPVQVIVTDSDHPKFVDFMIGSGGGSSEVKDVEDYDVFGSGTGTPGYWKNHPEAWPTDGVTVGGVHYVNDRNIHPNIWDAIALMGKVKGDKTFSMFSALIAAKLNLTPLLNNNDECIAGTLLKADAWLTQYPVGGATVIKASSPEWQNGADAWHQKLDDYNNGKLCAPHRD